VNCLITGAGGGIGKAVAGKFLEAGYVTHLLVHDPAKKKRIEEELEALSGRAVVHIGDITVYDVLEKLTEQIIEHDQGLDVVINCAGLLGEQKSIRDSEVDTWKRVVEVNMNGAFYLIKCVLPHMIETQGGVFINLTSSRAKYYKAESGAYSVSKHGTEAVTNIADLESKEYGVRCLAVNPGRVATEMRRRVAPDEDPSTITQPEEFADFCLKLVGSDELSSLPCSIDYDDWKDRI